MLRLSLANVMNYRKRHRLLSFRQHLQSKGKKSSEARAQFTVRLKRQQYGKTTVCYI